MRLDSITIKFSNTIPIIYTGTHAKLHSLPKKAGLAALIPHSKPASGLVGAIMNLFHKDYVDTFHQFAVFN